MLLLDRALFPTPDDLTIAFNLKERIIRRRKSTSKITFRKIIGERNSNNGITITKKRLPRCLMNRTKLFRIYERFKDWNNTN